MGSMTKIGWYDEELRIVFYTILSGSLDSNGRNPPRMKNRKALLRYENYFLTV